MITFVSGAQHFLTTLGGSTLDGAAAFLPLCCNNEAITCNNSTITCNATTYQS